MQLPFLERANLNQESRPRGSGGRFASGGRTATFSATGAASNCGLGLACNATQFINRFPDALGNICPRLVTVRPIRDGTGIDDFEAPELPKPNVPAKNVELVKPHMKQFDEWSPLAFFGL